MYKIRIITCLITAFFSSSCNDILNVAEEKLLSDGLILSGVVTTLAGTGTALSSDGTGTGAGFNQPNGITSDGTYLYLTDTGGAKIRKIEISTGVVTTIAGSGTQVSADGTGLSASFNSPNGITTDKVNLYVADVTGNCIRKIVIATGVVTTIAGSGTGSHVDANGTSATFLQPQGITTDGTNLYVAEAGNNCIRKIVISTGEVTTFAGTTGTTSGNSNGTGTAALFYQPCGMVTDGTYLYVADMGNNCIRKILLATAEVSTLAGSTANPGDSGYIDATGTVARFNGTYGITTDRVNLYVTDTNGYRVRKVVIATGQVTTVAGSGIAASTDGTGTSASFKNPAGITTDGYFLFVPEYLGYKIRMIQ